MSSEGSACQYVLVRYVADEIQDEPVNIGVIAYSPESRAVDYRFVSHWNRVQSRIPKANVDVLRTFIRLLSESVGEKKNDPTFLEKLGERESAQFRYSSVRGVLTPNLSDEVVSLFNRFITVDAPLRERRPSISRETIRKAIRTEVERYRLQERISEEFEVMGSTDRFVFDFAIHPPNGNGSKKFPTNLLHAVSLDVAEEQAIDSVKVLAFSVEDCKRVKEHAQTEFEVVLQPPREDASDRLKNSPLMLTSVGASTHWRQEIPDLVRAIQHTISR